MEAEAMALTGQWNGGRDWAWLSLLTLNKVSPTARLVSIFFIYLLT